MDILYLLTVLWRKKWIIILISMVSGGAAIFFTRNLPAGYKSVAQIATGFTTRDGVAISDEVFNLRESDVKFSNLLTTMNSGILLNMVSYRLVLHDLDPTQHPFHQLSQTSAVDIPDDELDMARDQFERKLKEMSPLAVSDPYGDVLIKVVRSFKYTYPWLSKSISIRRVPNTDFVRVEFISDDPDLSAFVVNTYCEEFFRYYTETRAENSSESVTFFKGLMDQKKEELAAKTEALRSYKANNSFVNIGTQGENNLAETNELERQKLTIESEIYGLDLKHTDLVNMLADVDNHVSTGSNNQKIIDLRQQINDLNQRYVNAGSNSKAMADSLSLLREQLKFELSRVVSQPGTNPEAQKADLRQEIKNNEIQKAIEQSKLNQVETKLRSLKGTMYNFASKEAAIGELEREVKVASDEYLNAVEKFNEANNKYLASSSSLRQVAKALPAATPESSKRLIIIGFSGVVTFALCIFVIVIIEVLDASIKTPRHFQSAVGIRLAGSLVKIDVKKLNYIKLFSQKHEDQRLEMFKHFLRKIRHEIESSGAKTFLVTSLKTQEGKSFTIFALGIILSLINKKVLIIDTNFKNNVLTRWLSKPETKVKLLEKGKGYAVKLYNGPAGGPNTETQQLVTETKYKNIFLIGNGGGYDSPEEIFNDRDFASLIEFLKSEYDYILLEGPALNDYSDSRELIKYVEKVILVLAADSSIKQIDQESLAYLKSLKGRLNGAILNKVDLRNLTM